MACGVCALTDVPKSGGGKLIDLSTVGRGGGDRSRGGGDPKDRRAIAEPVAVIAECTSLIECLAPRANGNGCTVTAGLVTQQSILKRTR